MEEEGEEEERRNFEKEKNKYSMTVSTGLNLPKGCPLFHVSKSPQKQKRGRPVSSGDWVLCSHPVHGPVVCVSVQSPSVCLLCPCLSGCLLVCLSACVSLNESRSALFSLPVLPLQLSSAVIPTEWRERWPPPRTWRRSDCFQMYVCV